MTILDVTDLHGRLRPHPDPERHHPLPSPSGEFVGILGHNGMGKTTLLKTLIGAVRADRRTG